jgi:hypothetical protein
LEFSVFLDQPIAWAASHWPTIAAAAVLVALLTGFASYIARRTSGAVLTAGIGALVATAFSADTSWRFAGHRLAMTDNERLGLFAAGEIALIACAVMARANKRATATDTEAGTPGVPGVLVWCITGVQLVPAFAESGVWGGLIRSVFGPVMAALLWHLAMGLEIRVAKPEALSTGLPAQIGHELRERLLSHLGLAVRGRTAAQVTRDRATARAVRLASRNHLGPWGRAALKASVARSGAATNAEQRHRLLQLLAARRGAAELRTVPVVSPWVPQPVPEAYPATPLGVTGAQLRHMDPLDALLLVRAAHPDATEAELASLSTEYGVPVSEAQVRVALHALPAPVPEVQQSKGPAQVQQQAPEIALFTAPAELPAVHQAVPDTVEYTYQAGGLHFDLTTEAEVRREHACAVPAQMIRPPRTRTEVHARVPDAPDGHEALFQWTARRAAEERTARTEQPHTRAQVRPVPQPVPVPEVQAPSVPTHPSTPDPASSPRVPGVSEDLLERARRVDAAHRLAHGRPAPIRVLKAELGVGQPKAELLRDALATTLIH